MSGPTASDDKRLAGKRCLVTGGSRGLGLAIATELARSGALVAFTFSRSEDDAADALLQIRQASDERGRERARSFKGTVADGRHAREVVDALVADWGGIDVLVNNAGVNQLLPISLIDEEEWDEIFDVNVKGTYLFTRAALRHMYRAKSGSILNVGSFASERAIESPIHYAATKSALRGFTEALASEVGRYGIRVNLIAPGLLEDGLSAMLPQHRVDEYLDQSALGRLARADEIARAAAFLVCDENSFMTGAKIAFDGGL